MKEDDAAVGKLRRPGLEIVAHRVVGVQAVDMQEIDRAVLDMIARLVECAAQQRREAGVALVVEGAELLEDFLSVLAGVRIALPGIDRVAARAEPAAHHGLAERRVGNAGEGAKLDQRARRGRGHDPVREGHVQPPPAHCPKPLRVPEKRIERGARQMREAAFDAGQMITNGRVGFVQAIASFLGRGPRSGNSPLASEHNDAPSRRNGGAAAHNLSAAEGEGNGLADADRSIRSGRRFANRQPMTNRSPGRSQAWSSPARRDPSGRERSTPRSEPREGRAIRYAPAAWPEA